MKYQTFLIEENQNETQVFQNLLSKLQLPYPQMGNLKIDVSSLRYGSKIQTSQTPGEIDILNWKMSEVENQNDAKYDQLLSDVIRSLNNFYSKQDISKSKFIKVSNVKFRYCLHFPESV